MIAIGCDHGAFELKNRIVEYFEEKVTEKVTDSVKLQREVQ